MAVALQYGYDYDINNGVTPYSASQTSQHSHAPTTQITTGTTASLTTSVGIQPLLKAGLQGSVLWDLASGIEQSLRFKLRFSQTLLIRPSLPRLVITLLCYAYCAYVKAILCILYCAVPCIVCLLESSWPCIHLLDCPAYV